jgi:hypothetical protein
MPTFHNQLQLFRSGRLSPWEPEHAKWIKQELFNLEQDDPKDAARFQELYDQKMAAYLAKQEVQPEEEVGTTIVVEPSETVSGDSVGEVTITEKPKRGRKKATSLPTPEL